jgi:integrase
VHWELGRYDKVLLRFGKGSRGRGPKQRLVPLINGARSTLERFVQDIWGHFDDDWQRLGAPLFPPERKTSEGMRARLKAEQVRAALAEAVDRHLPSWRGRLSPHVLRHYCARSCICPEWTCWQSRSCWGTRGRIRRCGTCIKARELHRAGVNWLVA